MGSKCRSSSIPNVDKVFVDRIQIQQVVVNLIRNAVEAMIDSPVRRLTVASRRRATRLHAH